MPADGYYERLDADRYQATRATESPWDERLQHGSPPTALLARFPRLRLDPGHPAPRIIGLYERGPDAVHVRLR